MINYTMIEWDEGFSIGVKTLDDDHKKILQIVNELLLCISDDKDDDEIGSIIKKLQRTTYAHFQREEDLLIKCNYDNIHKYTDRHEEFSIYIKKLKNILNTSNKFEKITQITESINNWLFTHILHEDMNLLSTFDSCEYLKNKTNKKISFKFTKRILISILLPIVLSLLFTFASLYNSYNKYVGIHTLSYSTSVLYNINKLTHKLQIERGLTSGYLSSSGHKFKNKLQLQKIESDKSIDLFLFNTNTIASKHINYLNKYIVQFKKDYEILKKLRLQVINQNLSANRVFDDYTKIIKNLIDVSLKITTLTSNIKVSSHIFLSSYILQYKEIEGQKRAYGTIIIEKDSQAEYKIFLTLIGKEEAILKNYFTIANKVKNDTLKNLLDTNLKNKINLYENKIVTQNINNLDSHIWFELMTKYINKIQVFENKLLYEMNTIIQNTLDEKIQKIYIFSFMMISLLILITLLLYLYNQNKKKDIDKFIEAMNDLSDGGRALRLTHDIQNKDVSKMYDSYEKTRIKLLIGDIYTQFYLKKVEQEIKSKEELNTELKNIAYVDQLTDLTNRRKYEEVSQIELERAIRNKEDLSFLMIDIDKFKRINDTYGHSVGDEVLKHFASTLKSIARPFDILARIGGEEFVVILPHTSEDGGFKFAERFRKNIYNSSLEIDNIKINYSISIGVSSLNPDIDNKSESILKRADEALYKAKNNGRNMTIIF